MNLTDKKKKNNIKTHVNVPKSKMKTNFEWLESNGELMFKENINTEIESPKKMKIKNLCQSNNSDLKDLSVNFNYKTENLTKDNAIQSMTEVTKMLQEKFGNNHK